MTVAGWVRGLSNRLTGQSVDPVQALIARGKEYSESGLHADAAATYQDALHISPQHAEAHHGLGLAWRDLQRFDDAAASYRRAVAIRPAYIEAHNNLGVVLQLQGKLRAALACYRDAVDLAPDFPQPNLNLGRLCVILKDHPQAARCYRNALARGLDPDLFGHLLNAITGTASRRAPAGYARIVFDEFAAHFDERLVVGLGYCMPELLGNRVREHTAGTGLRALDLGCGTGLCGKEIAACCSYLMGVDLSHVMLERARSRNVYHEFAEQDIEDYLLTVPALGFDAVLAADVFIYIGDLAALFTGVDRTLTRGGIFAFSIEHAGEESDYTLQSTGRYAHSLQYVRRLAALQQWHEIEASSQTMRRNSDGATDGRLIVMTKH